MSTDISKIPILANPKGFPPNFVNPPSLGPALLGIIITLMIVSFGVVIMRLAANIKQHGKIGVDDYFCILAWMLASSYGISAMMLRDTARHAWDIPFSALDARYFKLSAVTCVTVGPTLWSAKMAVFTLYLRLFGTVRWMRIACWIGIILTAPFFLQMVPVCGVYLFPHGNEGWDLRLGAKGSKLQTPSLILGTFNVVSDIYVFILPLPILYGLNLSLRKRIGLIGVFVVSSMGLVASALTLYYRVQLKIHIAGDSTWLGAAAWIAVSVEMFITISVSCAPACSACWKVILRDSALVTTLRSLLNSSRGSLSRYSERSAQRGLENSESIQNLHKEYELRGVSRDSNKQPFQTRAFEVTPPSNGIVKSIQVDQRTS